MTLHKSNRRKLKRVSKSNSANAAALGVHDLNWSARRQYWLHHAKAAPDIGARQFARYVFNLLQ